MYLPISSVQLNSDIPIFIGTTSCYLSRAFPSSNYNVVHPMALYDYWLSKLY